MIGLPNKTVEGYHVLLYRLSDFDYSKLHFADAIRVFCMFNDIKLSEDRLSNGYIVIFDMKGCSLGHLTRVTLPALRSFMLYIQVMSSFFLSLMLTTPISYWVALNLLFLFVIFVLTSTTHLIAVLFLFPVFP